MLLLAQTPARIARIQEQLPCKPSQTDTVIQCQQLGRDVSISVEHDRLGNLSHLGLHLFTPEMKQMSNPALCNCVERVMLEVLLMPTDSERAKFLKEYGMRLLYNGYPLGSPMFSSFKNSLKLVSVSSKSSFMELESGYEFRIFDDKDDALVLYFPKDREVIFGTDKKEQDDVMTQRLALGSGVKLSPKQPKTYTLKVTESQDMYRSPGQSFMIRQMSSEIFYVKNGTEFKPVFEAQHPLESYTNLLLGQIADRNFVVDLTHKRYGLTPPRFNVDWASLFNTLATQGSECYAAARLIDDGKVLSGVLVVSHGSYGYIDLLTVNARIEDLFAPGTPELKAYLFTNVPQNNLLNLFE